MSYNENNIPENTSMIVALKNTTEKISTCVEKFTRKCKPVCCAGNTPENRKPYIVL